MQLFYSTCPAGLEVPAARLAAREIKGFVLKQTFSGAVIYNAPAAKPSCSAFNNTYLLIAKRDKCVNLRKTSEEFSKDAKLLDRAATEMRRAGFKTFRVMFSEANQLQSMDAALRARFEKSMNTARIDRVKPDTELLILRRSDGCGLLLLRLTRPAATPKNLQKGELSPAVAKCMVALAKPGSSGAFLDPFSGHGALGNARLSMGRAKRICLSDIDRGLTKTLKAELGKRAEVLTLDALALSGHFPANSFEEIVTDPPWGLFAPLPLPEKQFYAEMLKQFEALLTPGGTLVMLTAAKDEMQAAVAESGMMLKERFDLLVNGKKAAIFVVTHKKNADTQAHVK